MRQVPNRLRRSKKQAPFNYTLFKRFGQQKITLFFLHMGCPGLSERHIGRKSCNYEQATKRGKPLRHIMAAVEITMKIAAGHGT
jgi:hypothetical protein